MVFLALAENTIQLVPDGTLFLHIVLILFMVFVLNQTLFRPINRILEEREKRTKGRSGEAQDIIQDIEKKLSHYENSLREARAAGYQLLERERGEALGERQTLVSSIKDDITRSVKDEKETIRKQAEQSRAELETEARRLASEISLHLLGR